MRVLIISHNSFNTKNNMGQTLTRLFCSFNKEELIQLYIHSDAPDIDKCTSYYNITDKDVISSILKRNKCGKEVKYNKKTNVIDSERYSYKKKNSFKLFIRDLVWKIGKWNSTDLEEWLIKYKPEVIFLAPGYSLFIYNIALKLAKKLNIPIITFFCDNYYTEKEHSINIFKIINDKLLNNKIKQIVNNSLDLIFVTEGFKEKYKLLFNKTGKVLYTPYDIENNDIYIPNSPLIVSYMGNISINRWKTLEKLGNAIKNINKDEIKILLNIYSGCSEQTIINKLNIKNASYFRGYVKYEKLQTIIKESDILLHVESFEKKDIIRVKDSMSTKIPNYLTSNRTILAIGDSSIESIKYLKQNKVAYIISDITNLEKDLKNIFVDNSIKMEYIINAKSLAERNHSVINNSVFLKSLIKKCLEVN